jgi:hypothetical protein
MIQAFRPVKTAFHFLYAVFFVLFFSVNPAVLLPVLLLLVSLAGFESFFRADAEKSYGGHYHEFDRPAVLKISILFSIFSMISAFYFGNFFWYLVLLAFAVFSSFLVRYIHFFSDFLLSLVLPALLLIHSPSYIILSPVYWFAFFWEISGRSLIQLSRPYGIESYTLPRIMGPEGAKEFVTVLLALCCIWPLLMSRYYPGISFIFFALSGLLFSAAVYALRVSHLENTRKLTDLSSAVFLLGLFISLVL